MKRKIALVLGTRPEIIKMYSLIKSFQEEQVDFILIHTNQHYSNNMDSLFFEQLELPLPDYNLNIGSGTHAKQTAKILTSLEKIMIKEKPAMLVVHGDTNSTLGGALYASKVGIPIAHVEAGLRSYDREMPEEINRILTDHVSDFLFAPTETAKSNLIKEGISNSKIHVVGNTIVDAINANMEKLKGGGNHLPHGQEPYILITLHRPSNVDQRENLLSFLMILRTIRDLCDYKIIFPAHPRTVNKISSFNLLKDITSLDVEVIEPVGYFEFLDLQKHSFCVITDSGGLQEEACILGVPCITLRNNTERPETIYVGSNVLVGLNDKEFKIAFKNILRKSKNSWVSPFGSGFSGKKISKIIQQAVQK